MARHSGHMAPCVLFAVVLLFTLGASPVVQAWGVGDVPSSWPISGMMTKIRAVLLTNKCEFVQNPAEAVRTSLNKEIVGQDLAIEGIVEAIAAWQEDRDAGVFAPLVLGISGSTGVGKTASASAIATALLTTRHGFIELRGEDYTDGSQIKQSQMRIKSSLVKHVQDTPGAQVVLIDEAQKAVTGVLDVLKPALEPDNPHMTLRDGDKDVTVSFRNTVFILISDIGMHKVQELMVKAGRDHANLASQLSKGIKAALNTYWAGFEIGGFVKSGIAFLPLTPDIVAQVVDLRLGMMNVTFSGKKWGSVSFDRGLVEHLCSSKYISYMSARLDGKVMRFAKFGARDVFVSMTGPVQKIKKKLLVALRPYDPKSHVTVTATGQDVSISVCDHQRQECAVRWAGRL